MSDLHALNLESGDIVGGYTLVSRLGAGAMGSVWRVVDGGGTGYAMKILRDSLDEDADEDARRDATTARERLRREAMALKRIKDPGVCAIVDMEIDDAVAFIVTELIEGKNLREDVAANGRYVGDDLERLASKLVDAVRAVHAAGIVHRDIKPTNVMISVTGPVLVDFGIAMGQGESHMTSTGLVMGTPGFIAPEIIEGVEANAATDWWSTASVLAFAATGAPVFGTQPMMAVLQREAAGNANLQGLPPRTMRAFRAALDPDPARRCTPEQLLEAIRADAWNAQETMPPFDAAAATTGAALRRNEDVGNPRRLWRAQSMPTAMISYDPAQLRGQRAAGADRADATTALDPAAMVSFPPTARVRRAPRTATSRPAAPEPAGGGEVTRAPRSVANARSGQAAVPSAPARGRDAFDALFADDARPPAPDPTSLTQAVQLTQALPEEPAAAADDVDPPGYDDAPAATADPPTPAGPPMDPRPWLARRGWLGCLLLTVPLALAAACAPVAAACAATALVWLLVTAALDCSAQVGRELRHDGERRGADGALRLVSLPWHLLKAVPFALPHALAMWLVDAGLVAAATALGGLPTLTLPVDLGPWTFDVPLPADAPYSMSGLMLGVSMAAGWLVAVCGPGGARPRLGAGALLGLTGGRRRALRSRRGANRRQYVWLAAFLACTLATAIGVETDPIVDWAPLASTLLTGAGLT